VYPKRTPRLNGGRILTRSPELKAGCSARYSANSSGPSNQGLGYRGSSQGERPGPGNYITAGRRFFDPQRPAPAFPGPPGSPPRAQSALEAKGVNSVRAVRPADRWPGLLANEHSSPPNPPPQFCRQMAARPPSAARAPAGEILFAPFQRSCFRSARVWHAKGLRVVPMAPGPTLESSADHVPAFGFLNNTARF